MPYCASRPARLAWREFRCSRSTCHETTLPLLPDRSLTVAALSHLLSRDRQGAVELGCFVTAPKLAAHHAAPVMSELPRTDSPYSAATADPAAASPLAWRRFPPANTAAPANAPCACRVHVRRTPSRPVKRRAGQTQ